MPVFEGSHTEELAISSTTNKNIITVVLKNGNKIRGIITEQTADYIRLKTYDGVKQLVIYRSDIENIESDNRSPENGNDNDGSSAEISSSNNKYNIDKQDEMSETDRFFSEQESSKVPESEDRLSFFVKAGPGISKWTKIKSTGFSFRIGGGATYKALSFLSVETSLNLVSRGFHYEENLGDFMGTSVTRTDNANAFYLTIPVLARAEGAIKGKHKISFGVGFSFDIGLGGTYKITSTASSEAVTKSKYFDNIRRFDFSIVYDLRYEIKEHWLVGMEFSNGLINLQKGVNSDNFGFWIYTGYVF